MHELVFMLWGFLVGCLVRLRFTINRCKHKVGDECVCGHNVCYHKSSGPCMAEMPKDGNWQYAICRCMKFNGKLLADDAELKKLREMAGLK